ncbi:MAG: hypothetical protein GY952_13940 [Rhodobacteraceae bacterium]|nr:hypothetical protein [Paracoccaceae bacterium]
MIDQHHNEPPTEDRLDPPPPWSDEPLFTRMQELISSARVVVTDFPEITSQDMANKYGDAVRQMQDHVKQCEEARRKEKKPLDDQIKDIQNKWANGTKSEDGQTFWLGIMALPAKAIDIMLKRTAAWNKAEAERIRKEEEAARAEVARKEEEQRQAAIKAAREMEEADAAKLVGKGNEVDPLESDATAEKAKLATQEAKKDLAQVRKQKASAGSGRLLTSSGTKARKVTTRKVYSAVVKDHRKALKYFRDHPKVVDAVQVLANEMARGAATRDKLPKGVKLVVEDVPT